MPRQFALRSILVLIFVAGVVSAALTQQSQAGPWPVKLLLLVLLVNFALAVCIGAFVLWRHLVGDRDGNGER